MIVAADPRPPNTRHRTSPRARRMLHDAGLREDDVIGTGPSGRILAADVASAQASAPPARSGTYPSTDLGGADAQSRRKESTTAFVAAEVDFHAVDRARREAGADVPGYPAFVARAVVDALTAYPYLNAQLGDHVVSIRRPVHLGIHVDLDPTGPPALPVIRDADGLRLRSLADRIADAEAQARERRGAIGCTFTIVDATPHGMLLSSPPLGPGQVAALTTSGVRPMPIAVEREPGEYAVAVHPVGTLGLSFDHAIVGSGYAAGFLDHVRTALEQRDWAAEL
ncbi:MAG TPA: 2-oxo acid dehydrogenase subunit E2 [Nocardioidaceae bacterium]|nr:2-oxo acid dehydrogenase subunit E2 [Nocardioidaceae bacterium]